jgi:AAA ATPase domain
MYLPPEFLTPGLEQNERLRIRATLSSAFSPHAPVDNSLVFAGRTNQMRRLLSTIASRGEHAIVYGERGVGKTSLVIVVRDYLRESHLSSTVVRVNCDKADDFSSLWRKVFAEVRFTQRRAGLRNSKELEPLGDLVPEHATPDDVRRLLSVVSEGELFVAIFDEFDRLVDEHGRALFADVIKGISDYSVPATLILVGVAESVESLLQEHLSLGRNLVQIPMPRMTQPESAEIIDKGLAKTQMKITSSAKNYIARVAQGLPYYVHLVAQSAAYEAIDSGTLTIDIEHVGRGMRSAMENTMSTIRSHYQQALRSARTEKYPQVLLACAIAPADETGYFTASAIRRPLEIFLNDVPSPVSSFAKHLERLCDSERGGLLEKHGEARRYAYRFKDSLVPPYVVMRGLEEGVITNEMLDILYAEKPMRPKHRRR